MPFQAASIVPYSGPEMIHCLMSAVSESGSRCVTDNGCDVSRTMNGILPFPLSALVTVVLTATYVQSRNSIFAEKVGDFGMSLHVTAE